MRTVTKVALTVGVLAAGVLGAGVAEHYAHAAQAPGGGGGVTPPTPQPTTGTTISVPLSAPSSGTQGNLGIVALGANASLLLVAPQGASISQVVTSGAGMLTVASSTAQAASVQASQGFFTSPVGSSLTVYWTDASGTGQTSTLQVVAELPTTTITLAPGTMPNVILPAVGGQLLFVPPTGTANGPAPTGSVSGSGVVGAVYPTNPLGSYGVVATAPGNATVTVNWTDATGTQQTSTFAVNVTAS